MLFSVLYNVVMMKKKTLIFDLGGVLLDIYIDRSFGALMALGIDSSILTEKRCLMDV